MINQITANTLNQHLYPHRDRSDSKVADHASKPQQSGSLSSETSQKVLNEKLVEAIDRVLQKNNAAPVRTLDAQDYTPQAVSKRILGFVQDAIERAEARGTNRNAILAQARQGVNRGFQDAENLLASLNALSGKIAEGVRQTFDLIQGGLDKLSQSISNPSNSSFERINFESYEQSFSQSLSLDITTQDGDTLTLNFEKNQSTGATYAQVINNQSNTAIGEVNFSSNSQFELAIQGSLDEGEIEAIQQLLNDVKGVSNQFFKGDAGAALEAGLGLGFNTSELASFSLNLNQNQSQSVVQAYREISGFNDQAQSLVQMDNLLSPIQDFAKSLEQSLFHASQSNSFDENAVENLFNFFSRGEEGHRNAIEQLELLSGGNFENIVNDIISQIKS